MVSYKLKKVNKPNNIIFARENFFFQKQNNKKEPQIARQKIAHPPHKMIEVIIESLSHLS